MPEHYEGIRYLGPGDITFASNNLGQLSATLADGTAYDDVLVFCTRPISDPLHYISVRVGVTTSEQREIGLIRSLDALPHEQRALVKGGLARRYFIHTITRIVAIREEFGYLYWDCETDKGRREFPVPRWDQSKVVNVGDGCHIVTDVDGNRYEIPNLQQLDIGSQAAFNRFIYW